MTILYAGTLSPFGTCFSRFISLRELEPDVQSFDTDRDLDWRNVPRLMRAGILALIDAGLPVTVYGHAACFAPPRRAWLGDHLQPSLGVEDHERALGGARIGLCFVSVLNCNQTASRSFEIPGSGTLPRAIRTDQHLECYEEGKEAEFFSGDEELVREVKYYLEHEDEREAIAARGHARCVESGYSWDATMARDWPKVRERFESQNPSNGAGVDTK